MATDIFTKTEAQNLLINKKVLIFGDSNIRALYKDLIWLLEEGTFVTTEGLKRKNEPSFSNDVRLSDGKLLNSRNYREIREYNRGTYVRFQFITRLYLPEFIEYLEYNGTNPDIIIINSCLWDLSRWGPTGVADYKENLKRTFRLLHEKFSHNTKVIWLTALPPSFTCEGSILTKEIEFLRKLLPFHILEANNYARECANQYSIDVLDVHFHMRFMIHERVKDGIHWSPKSVRYVTNLLLTHLCMSFERKLPGVVKLNETFFNRTKFFIKKDEKKEVKERINNLENQLSKITTVRNEVKKSVRAKKVNQRKWRKRRNINNNISRTNFSYNYQVADYFRKDIF